MAMTKNGLQDQLNSMEAKVDVITLFMHDVKVAQFYMAKSHFIRAKDLQTALDLLAKDISDFNQSVQPNDRLIAATTISKIQDSLFAISAKYYAVENDHNNASQGATSAAGPVVAPAKMALKALEIPKFSGVLAEFQPFWGLFESCVDANKSFSDTQKLAYLRSVLEGDALDLVKNLALQDSSYPIARQILEKKYLRSRPRLSQYVENLMGGQGDAHHKKLTYQQLLTLIRQSNEGLRSVPKIDLGDFLVFHMAYLLLSPADRRRFDLQLDAAVDIPTLKELTDFLDKQVAADMLRQVQTPEKPKAKQAFLSKTAGAPNRPSNKCPTCNQASHFIGFCPKFLSYSPRERYDYVKAYRGCIVCLSFKHDATACKATKFCDCGKRHASLLHFGSRQAEPSPPSAPKQALSFQGGSQLECLLPTVSSFVLDAFGKAHKERGLVDLCANVSLIERSLVHKLHLGINPSNIQLVGVGDKRVRTYGSVSLRLFRRNPNRAHTGDEDSMATEFLVVDRVSGDTPSSRLPDELVDKLKGPHLADSEFYIPAPVLFLVGLNATDSLFSHSSPIVKGFPTQIFTRLGVLLCGDSTGSSSSNQGVAAMGRALAVAVTPDESDQTLLSAVERFWAAEEINDSNLSASDEYAEKHFQENTRKDPITGQYHLAYPLLPNFVLGPNNKRVKNIFLSQEAKLASKPKDKKLYDDSLAELLASGKMSAVTSPPDGLYLIPHLGVYKGSEEAGDRKVRVVFNASFGDANQNSLNSSMVSGPKLHRDLSSIILRLRLGGPYVVIADLSNMFTSFPLVESQRYLQRILARIDANITVCQLNTVIFGAAASPFICMRAVQSILEENRSQYPVTCELAAANIYVDDLILAFDSVSEAIQVRDELTNIFAKAKLSLKKWVSNSTDILAAVPEADISVLKDLGGNLITKVLGLIWSPEMDHFLFNIVKFEGEPTKRTILRFVAKIFDPLGFLTPIVFFVKHLLQQLWELKLKWDDPLPPAILMEWSRWVNDTHLVEDVRIPRNIPIKGSKVTLVGFSDGSNCGYACAFYVCTVNAEGKMDSQLFLAKSRVSPVKGLSIPRTELNGALLLSEALQKIRREVPQLAACDTVLFTDSQIVLAWFKTDLAQLKPYVSSRVRKIRENTANASWFYVASAFNAADLACKPQVASAVCNNELWFKGPAFLRQDRSSWPATFNVDINAIRASPDFELRPNPLKALIATAALPGGEENRVYEYIQKFSSYGKMVRVVAYLRRFKYRQKVTPFTAEVSAEELRLAETTLVKLVQVQEFPTQLKSLSQGKCPQEWVRLTPYVDGDGVIKIGGRLEKSSLLESEKHPFLLAKSSILALPMARDLHIQNFHVGSETIRALLRKKAWVTGSSTLVRKLVRTCPRCIRYNAPVIQPIMSDLPKSRLEIPGFAFERSATDLCGPWNCKSSSLRNAPITKCYLVIFLCEVTRAVHLEVCSSLTTEAYLAALQRFIARRNCPKSIRSDQGTNLVAGGKVTRQAYEFLAANSDKILSFLAKHNIDFLLNTALASNRGGGYERQLQQVQKLFHKQMGDRTFTYEELATIFARCEQIINGRPLISLSWDVDTKAFLTPSHFLGYTGAIPLPDLESCDRLALKCRWEAVRSKVDALWQAWKTYYLTTLQQRHRWTKDVQNVKVGDIVLLTGENCRPLAYPLGRIEEVYPDAKGVVRSVRVFVAGRPLVRPVNKMKLLISDDA